MDITYCFAAPTGEAKCRVRIFRHGDGSTTVIITELQDNPGMSITNAIELIAAGVANTYALSPERTVWIEHYPDRHPPGMENDPMFDETFDVVTFRWVQTGSGEWTARRPRWRRIDREEAERLAVHEL